MGFFESFKRFNRAISGRIEWIGIVAFLLMMAITCIDVIGAKLFRAPVPGSIDLVMIAQIVAISFVASMTLIMGKHIQVEIFASLLPRRVRAVTNCIVNLFGLAIFVLLVWRLFEYGHSFQTGGEESGTIRIPLYPIAYCAAFALIPATLVYLQHFIESVLGVIKNES